MPTSPRATGPADPALTANLYCTGRLDAAIQRVLAPFWEDVVRADPDRACRLWWFRYRCRREHLKIRIHAPEPLLPDLRRDLTEKTTAFFDGLGPQEPEAGTPAPAHAPPIDVEDEDGPEPSDASLLWTRYRRSHVTFGGGPLLADDTYAAFFARSLSHGCHKVLHVLTSAPASRISFGARQTALWNLLIPALAVVGFGAGKRSAYLAYHRDWLLRFPLLRHTPPQEIEERTAEVIAHFDQRLATMGAIVGALRSFAEECWDSPTENFWDHLTGPWVTAVGELYRYIEPLCRERGADPDLGPYTDDTSFVSLLKLFHGIANPLGLNLIEEAFAHHALLRGTATATSPPRPATTGTATATSRDEASVTDTGTDPAPSVRDLR